MFCDEFSFFFFLYALGIDDGRVTKRMWLGNGDARCNEMYARFGLIIVMVGR